jgi:isoleucyl-tRNA synthetase
MEDWDRIYAIRDEVNKALEAKRQEGIIGSALAAEVVVYASADAHRLLERLADELRFILITSSAMLLPMSECSTDALLNEELGVAVEVKASSHPKCNRCWHRREEVGSHPDHPELCTRCVDNISGHDELRQFA